MNRQIRPHPSPLPKGEGTRLLAPFSLGRRVGDEGDSYFHSATPQILLAPADYIRAVKGTVETISQDKL
ncbi:MAG: hypothetical protein LH660_04740 [Phormidesmis sp. CAN_BIN36]|nr:hypothetical protein [Phormidesmis sp. CAN_BIN36]